MGRCIEEAIHPHVLQHNRGEIIDEQLHNQLARVAVLPTAEKLVCSYYISLGQKSISWFVMSIALTPVFHYLFR